MLGVVGSSLLLLLTSFPLPAVLIKGVLEEQEEGLPEQGRAGRTFCSHFDWHRQAAHMLCFIKDTD